MKWTIAASLLLSGAAAGHGRFIAAEMPAPRVLVVAELFTSEGCSSCPPADDELRRLASRQPVAGVEVVALGEHVDYWNQLGWRDPFSSAAFSARQSEYDARVFHANQIYTPQAVIDGRFERIGSDGNALERAIREAARLPRLAISVVAGSSDGGRVPIDIKIDAPTPVPGRGIADVVLAVTEDGLMTAVRRGENGGRTLRHAGVVRSLTTVGTIGPSETSWRTGAAVSLAPEWRVANLHVVSFVQERESRRIIGAGITLIH